jgi:hypothetical protein
MSSSAIERDGVSVECLTNYATQKPAFRDCLRRLVIKRIISGYQIDTRPARDVSRNIFPQYEYASGTGIDNLHLLVAPRNSSILGQ